MHTSACTFVASTVALMFWCVARKRVCALFVLLAFCADCSAGVRLPFTCLLSQLEFIGVCLCKCSCVCVLHAFGIVESPLIDALIERIGKPYQHATLQSQLDKRGLRGAGG